MSPRRLASVWLPASREDPSSTKSTVDGAVASGAEMDSMSSSVKVRTETPLFCLRRSFSFLATSPSDCPRTKAGRSKKGLTREPASTFDLLFSGNISILTWGPRSFNATRDPSRESSLMTELDGIRDQLRRAFRDDAWHGPSLKELLEGVNAQHAMSRPIADGHTIWELVLHITTWTEVPRPRMEGDRVADP